MDSSETPSVETLLKETAYSQEECDGKPGEKQQSLLPEDMFYSYDDLQSRPFITRDSSIPQNLLHLSHSFGYECGRRANLQLLDQRTLAFIAGNLLVLLDLHRKNQRYIRSSSGGGIAAFMPHPSKQYFAVAEKGYHPYIIIYEFPSLQPYRILRGGTARSYSAVNFSRDGTLLASVGASPDHMFTIWDWKQEQVMLNKKAFPRDVYRVTFSDCVGQLTTSGSGHISFWNMAKTQTGLRLEGLQGRFGKTKVSDIEGYLELSDGKVVSGSEWGNMLLWEGGLIKVEICRKDGRPCHSGSICQFSLDDGELLTIGSDGAVRGWNLEAIDAADAVDESGLFEMEPMNEMILGHKVRLCSMVKSSTSETSVWFAQDSNGGIWKLDLSFSNFTQDPECLFSFHAGAIQGMDVSGSSHLMATTTLDSTVRIFDFLSKKELTVLHFRQGGTSLTWAPDMVNTDGGSLVVGFEDGVVRFLELYDPLKLTAVAGRKRFGDAELRLALTLKPHDAPVTAIAFERSGRIMATGSADSTVFFFTVGEPYEPIGFVWVPGPVRGLEWSPHSHELSTLLVFCQNGHVMEIQCPDPEAKSGGRSFLLSDLLTRHFCFSSIKSRIKREEEVALRQAKKELLQTHDEEHQEVLDEEEEEPLYIPSPPSSLLCGFYSAPGSFWISMDGYDSGFLYHCKFPEHVSDEPSARRDEPFSFIPVADSDQNSIFTISFNLSKQLMFCGMEDGSIRAYSVQNRDLISMQAYWALSIHDNQCGHVRHVRCSYDDAFVLTGGEDGNIFSFSFLPAEELHKAVQHTRAAVPSPRVGLEMEKMAQDIEDPTALSVEAARQKQELDSIHQKAEQRKQETRQKLLELQKQFQALLEQNQSIPEHLRLHRSEFELDPCFRENIERHTEERVMEVRKEMAWEEEKSRIALKKLQNMFFESVGQDTVTVCAFESDHSISSYRPATLPAVLTYLQLHPRGSALPPSRCVEKEQLPSKAEKDSSGVSPANDGLLADDVKPPEVIRFGKLGSRQAERLRIAAEKAEKARLKIENRKKEWAELYESKPSWDYKDPKDLEAIRLARESIGDIKLKSARDYVVPEHLRMNVERKKSQLVELEKKIFEKKSAMNKRLLTLRDKKVEIISQLVSQLEQLQRIQKHLPVEKRRPAPRLPVMMPEETPERKYRYTRATLEQFSNLRAKIASEGLDEKPEGERRILELIEKQTQVANVEKTHVEIVEAYQSERDEAFTELEKEMREVEIIRALSLQDRVLAQMEEVIWRFDAELRLLRHEKQKQDVHLKLADLRLLTLSEELLLLNEYETREQMLQDNMRTALQEEQDVTGKMSECKKLLEVKKKSIQKLKGIEKKINKTFQASLGEDNKFEELLNSVFRKQVSRLKTREKSGSEGEREEAEEQTDEESDEESDVADEDLGDSEHEAFMVEDVCPQNCDPNLFESTLRLREHRLDIEEQLQSDARSLESLKKEYDALAQKEQIVQNNCKDAENALVLINREKQQRMNELDVVVPLRIHQIENVINGLLPGDLDLALVLNTGDLERLQTRIKELHQEKNEQEELYKQAMLHHQQLRYDLKKMGFKIKESETRCKQQMLMKFGKMVDLDVLRTLSGNRKLEEVKQEIREQDIKNEYDLKGWEEKVIKAREELNETMKENTEKMHEMCLLMSQKRTLDLQLQSKKSQMVNSHHLVDKQDLQNLQQIVELQAEDIKALTEDIYTLSRKDSRVLPPLDPALSSAQIPGQQTL